MNLSVTSLKVLVVYSLQLNNDNVHNNYFTNMKQ